MKRSELKEFLRTEIISVLSEVSSDDVKTQKAYNDELEKTASEIARILKPGKVMGWVIADQWIKKKFTAVGFLMWHRLEKYFEPVFLNQFEKSRGMDFTVPEMSALIPFVEAAIQVILIDKSAENNTIYLFCERHCFMFDSDEALESWKTMTFSFL